jgi:hypothetical protein
MMVGIGGGTGMSGGMGMGGPMGLLGGIGGGADETEVRRKQIRTLIPALAARVAARDGSPRSRKVAEILERPVEKMALENVNLREFAEFLSAQAGRDSGPLSVYFDKPGLEEVDQTMDSTIDVTLVGVPLKVGLRLALKQVGLSYCVSDGVLFISSPEGVYEELQEAERRAEAARPQQH